MSLSKTNCSSCDITRRYTKLVTPVILWPSSAWFIWIYVFVSWDAQNYSVIWLLVFASDFVWNKCLKMTKCQNIKVTFITNVGSVLHRKWIRVPNHLIFYMCHGTCIQYPIYVFRHITYGYSNIHSACLDFFRVCL